MAYPEPMADLDTIKDRLHDLVDAHADVLIDASHQIHDHPELGYEEHFAHDLLTSVLKDAGVDVEQGAYGLETAFAGRAGSTGPTVAVLCEYDALPVIGHACGHNVIGTAGLGAGIAAAALAEELGGRLLILGTPAEEGGGGKVKMAEHGAFEGVDAAMMVHPAGVDLPSFGAIAIQTVEVVYTGRAAHAAAAPQKGLNALDAAVLGYMNVAALRQHIRPDERIHGIFTEAGDAANVVPDRTAAKWYVRSPKMRSLEALKARVVTCLEAGAAAAGCTMEHAWQDPAYADLVHNDPFMALYAANAERVGRSLTDLSEASGIVGSTDMGNVSHMVPSIHPMIQVSPPNVAIHTIDFVRYAGGEEGDRAVIDGAKMLACTVADLWCQPGKLEEVRAAFGSADREA
jgi:amidohydrolase